MVQTEGNRRLRSIPARQWLGAQWAVGAPSQPEPSSAPRGGTGRRGEPARAARRALRRHREARGASQSTGVRRALRRRGEGG
eukprot:scaffold48728_cov45-Phaeocystis_antarctica.AAC.1